ncbi:transporter substrate-binding domain-containing protein [Candidatus Sulfurimonas marisnigri]|uniref:histidine kinase n=1 Tax=Candidatus Sulfurimonas marisnigri TaxID=2740405 RepID=A0A7S7RQ23_9BACT|nr:transporter substrate-binding domain-containing protein [Candidatus Sulfurimonas marisnigri]QOY54236.1 transporter substrate-binding domain-containing protein [Candidatus Sulfurimonas marisnigri]
MKKIFIFFLFLASLLANTNSDHLKFTDKEQIWINKKIPITYVYDIDWAPFEWKNEVNRHTGIISDILNLISKKSNLKFEAIHTNNWSKAVLLAENNKVDMYSAIPYSKDRAKYMNFISGDIFQYNACFIKHSNDKTDYNNNLHKELINKTIAIVRSSSLGNSVKSKYPQAKYIEVEKTEDGFEKLESADIDLFVINSATADYMINTRGYNNLEVAKKLDEVFKLKIAISKSMPEELLSIIDKTIAHIDKNKIDKIYNKWISPVHTDKTINWNIVIYVIIISSIIVLLLIYRQYLLYKSNKNLETIVQERTNDLEDSKETLKKINATLEYKIKKEVEENQQKDRVLFQQSKMASMGEMIGNIAHQWRQPISIISMWANNIIADIDMGDVENQELRKYAVNINEQTQHLSQTIDDFRNFFIPNKNPNTFTLKDSIDKTMSLLAASLKTHNIEVIKNIEDIEITALENEFTQALLNIIKNAKDILVTLPEDKRKLILIDIYKKDNIAIIEIKDSGGGVPENTIDKVFEPYFTTKHKSQGTGVGLYMTESIVTKHLSGEISVSNEEFKYANEHYKGAKFTIKLLP